jgi:hypothetical protein
LRALPHRLHLELLVTELPSSLLEDGASTGRRIFPPGGTIYELVCDTPGEFPFVNHGFGHGQKGAMGILVVDS